MEEQEEQFPSPHAVTYYHLTILSVSSSSSISNRHSILTKMSEKKKRPITTMKIEGNFALMSLAIPRCVLFYFYPLTHIVDRMLFAYICLLHTAPCAASFFCCVCSSVRSYLSTWQTWGISVIYLCNQVGKKATKRNIRTTRDNAESTARKLQSDCATKSTKSVVSNANANANTNTNANANAYHNRSKRTGLIYSTLYPL